MNAFVFFAIGVAHTTLNLGLTVLQETRKHIRICPNFHYFGLALDSTGESAFEKDNTGSNDQECKVRNRGNSLIIYHTGSNDEK